ncbi:hypothetical protein MNEG_13485 [Monoraphidium neglectum]|uniref:Uncharacterized protein n=1 Tax=Monoraphidium neglectum TaxID=145388 RepID=A0A0D2J3E0_9CHLO|nr:hypothetical protein MNEG_13485 [Monoraphidium neglectum]KIY94477.1 hypothetical protein MNEG_13485 [Monoraphidium neglectum]|eukprot:XP_013893497.1 hypothetical protein MNEG_13485 [Monoraphidium neglectum]
MDEKVSLLEADNARLRAEKTGSRPALKRADPDPQVSVVPPAGSTPRPGAAEAEAAAELPEAAPAPPPAGAPRPPVSARAAARHARVAKLREKIHEHNRRCEAFFLEIEAMRAAQAEKRAAAHAERVRAIMSGGWRPEAAAPASGGRGAAVAAEPRAVVAPAASDARIVADAAGAAMALPRRPSSGGSEPSAFTCDPIAGANSGAGGSEPRPLTRLAGGCPSSCSPASDAYSTNSIPHRNASSSGGDVGPTGMGLETYRAAGPLAEATSEASPRTPATGDEAATCSDAAKGAPGHDGGVTGAFVDGDRRGVLSFVTRGIRPTVVKAYDSSLFFGTADAADDDAAQEAQTLSPSGGGDEGAGAGAPKPYGPHRRTLQERARGAAHKCRKTLAAAAAALAQVCRSGSRKG